MEAREWARLILEADTLDQKLLNPGKLTDNDPGLPVFYKEPVRPPGMGFNKRSKQEKLPSFQDLRNEEHRAVCLHRFAGHELLAVEIMAYALIAFPEAPKDFRKGLIKTLKEEQGHVRLYMRRLKELGLNFGDLPLYKHFWAAVKFLHNPIQYVSVMSLTFEMANLDFAPTYGLYFDKFNDPKSSNLMRQIFKDELRHVNFGWQWLNQMKGIEDSSWDTYVEALPPYLTPKRARGQVFHEDHRRMAGIPDTWINNFKKQ